MSFKCKIGLHSWNGCKCSECGKKRKNQHDWSKDCEKCSTCGKKRENQHDWTKNCGICSKCYIVRENMHEWSRDCTRCSKCNTTRSTWNHNWENCKCSICGKKFDPAIIKNDPKTFLENGSRLVKEVIEKYPEVLDYTVYYFNYPYYKLIHLASAEGLTDVVEVLVKYGSDIQSTPKNMYSPLHFAVMNGHLDTVKILLELHANPNIFKPFDDYNYGGTPLHLVIMMLKFVNEEKQITFLKIAQLLIDHGTILFEKYDGSTLLEFARSEKKSNIVALMPKLKILFNSIKISFEVIYKTSIGPGGRVKISYGKYYNQCDKLLFERSYEEFKIGEKILIPELIPINYEEDGFPSSIMIIYWYQGKEERHFIEPVILNNKSEYIYENPNHFGLRNLYRTYIKMISK